MRAEISYCFFHRSHPLAETPVPQLVTFLAVNLLILMNTARDSFHGIDVTAAQHFDCPGMRRSHDASKWWAPGQEDEGTAGSRLSLTGLPGSATRASAR